MTTSERIIIILLTVVFFNTDFFGQELSNFVDSVKSAKLTQFKLLKIKSVKTVYYRIKNNALDSGKIFNVKEYDSQGNILKLIRPNNTSPFLHGPLWEDSAYYSYDSIGRKIEEIEFKQGSVTSLRYKYNNKGMMTEEKEFHNGTIYDSTINKYDINGNIIESITYYPTSDSVKYSDIYFYNIHNKLITQLWISESIDTLERKIIIYDNSKGIVKRISYNRNRKPTFTEINWFDELGFNIKETYWFPKNIFEDKIRYTKKYYKYDEKFDLSQEIEFDNDRYYGKSVYYYNDKSLLIEERNYDENKKLKSIIRYFYEYY